MFDSLSGKLNTILSRLRGKGKLSEADVDSALREIRLALLEADVNYKVAKELIASVHDRAIGSEVLESLTPGQQVVKVIRDELAALMGEERIGLLLTNKPAVIMLVGLQGCGKTTTAAKLALILKKEGKKSVLVAADVYRPAAVEQLRKLGEEIELPVFEQGSSPAQIVTGARNWAEENLCDVVIIDTAGRLQIDQGMMNELVQLKNATSPDEILLVADAMTGQEAVNIASSFHEKLSLSGVVLTKLDGDARGGAALSIRAVTGCPIKFVGVGEKLPEIEAFHPKRMAERILGMGDMLSLIEQAEGAIDQKKAEEIANRIRKDRFTLQDFHDQLQEMRKMGPISQILEKLPGGGRLKESANVDEQELDRALAILRSMTLEERLNPSIIGGSRKKRIARGSGARVRDVNSILSRFKEAKRAIKFMGTGRGKSRFPPEFLQPR